MKHIERLKKIVGIAFKNDWIVRSPFKNITRVMIPTDRECLESNELD